MKYVTNINGKEFIVEVVDEKHIIVNGQKMEVDFASVSGQPVYSIIIGGKSYEAYVNPGDENWEVLLRGHFFPAKVEDEREKRLRAAGGGKAAEGGEYHLRAPMPGLVVAVTVSEGQKVEKGQVLVILESMKMQNELKSPKEGMISRVKVKVGDRVEQKTTMVSVI
jgi:acetyl/propionyl-CoA carboxylase alpha subunit